MSWTKAVAVFFAFTGCSSDAPGTEDAQQDVVDTLSCDAVLVPALRVTVTDGVDGPRICDASVTATPEGIEPTGEPNFELNPGAECDYSSASGAPGVYDVLVTTPSGKSGRANQVAVGATADGCHALTVGLTIAVE